MNPRAELEAGLRALRSNTLKVALEHFDAVLADLPDSTDALYLSGIALAGLGQIEGGIERLKAAISGQPRRAPLHYNLGKLLADADQPIAAEAAYRTALSLQPDYAEALANLALLIKERGETAEASACFQRSFLLRQARPVAQDTASTTRMKLRHDLEQFEHLGRRGLAVDRLPRLRAAQVRVLEELRRSAPDTQEDTPQTLSSEQQSALADSHKRVLHLDPGLALASPAVNSVLASEQIEQNYRESSPRLVVVDDLLTPDALQALRRHCLDSTFWFSDRYQGGYLGAYWEQGFGAPLLVQIAQELRAALPDMLGPHPLQQMWAYKYDSTGGGIGVHADSAAVNVNFWITPDDANLDPTTGGLVVHHARAPKDWDHTAYNSRDSEDKIEALIAREGGAETRIPYRANRAVLFDSDLFHRTDHYRFRPGYDHRRINVTMLFGWRDGKR